MQTQTNTETISTQRRLSRTNVLTKVAVLSSIAYVMMLLEFPLPFAPGFFENGF